MVRSRNVRGGMPLEELSYEYMYKLNTLSERVACQVPFSQT